MQKIKSLYLVITAILFMLTSSAGASSFLTLSPELQVIHEYWSQVLGVTFFPYVEYKDGAKTHRQSFFSDERRYGTAVEISSNLSEFVICLLSAMNANYIKFTFNSEIFGGHPTVQNATGCGFLYTLFEQPPQSLLHDGFYFIDINYIFNSDIPTQIQCLLTEAFTPEPHQLITTNDVI